MRGPEHYAEAERLTADAAALVQDAGMQTIGEAVLYANHLLARAQVHATLAQAAATAAGWSIPADGSTASEWRQLIARPSSG